MTRNSKLFLRNLKLARKRWSKAREQFSRSVLREISENLRLDIAAGDLVLLNGHWYVTHSGLLHLAKRRRCIGINVEPVEALCEKNAARFVFRATVFTGKSSTGFVGYGDADPSNVSSLVRGAEMRVAETRAVNRALRKAYGIGLCSVEEIGSAAIPEEKRPPQNTSGNGNGNGSAPKVRDRLCQLIRQHKLDPALVKAYAVDFCGTKTLRDASRERVESFVQQLAEWAEKDRNALLCQLNSYLPPKQEERAA